MLNKLVLFLTRFAIVGLIFYQTYVIVYYGLMEAGLMELDSADIIFLIFVLYLIHQPYKEMVEKKAAEGTAK